MPLPPIPLVEKAAGMSIEELLPRVLKKTVDHETMAEFCTAYRRIGICRFLMSGIPDELFSYLSMSGRAFLFYLLHTEDEAKATSKSEPFLDAMACGDLDGAQQIIAASRRTWNPNLEYEEDFLYIEFLMKLLSPSPASLQQLQSALIHYEALVGDQEDHSLELCRALLARDNNKFDEALDSYMGQKYRLYRQRLSAGQLFPDDAVTTEQVCIEAIALVWLARHLGMDPHPGELLMPSSALLFSRARLPPPNAWKHLSSYRELD